MLRRLAPSLALLLASTILVTWLAVRRDPGPGPVLRALRADPMASYVPSGGRQTLMSEQDQGSALGKPLVIQTARTFEMPADGAGGVLRDAVRAARRAGWRRQAWSGRHGDEIGGSTVYLFDRKILRDRPADLAVSLEAPSGSTARTPWLIRFSLSSGT